MLFDLTEKETIFSLKVFNSNRVLQQNSVFRLECFDFFCLFPEVLTIQCPEQSSVTKHIIVLCQAAQFQNQRLEAGLLEVLTVKRNFDESCFLPQQQEQHERQGHIYTPPQHVSLSLWLPWLLSSVMVVLTPVGRPGRK